MSSSNLAASMEHTATDQLSTARPDLRATAANGRRPRSLRHRLSFTNRKFVPRDQGLRLFRVR